MKSPNTQMILVVSLVYMWTIVIPIILSAALGFATRSDIEKRAPQNHPSIVKSKSFQKEKELLNKLSSKLREELAAEISKGELSIDRVKAIEQLQEETKSKLLEKPPVTFAGTFDARGIYYIFVCYLCLILHLGLLLRDEGFHSFATMIRIRSVLISSVWIYIFWQISNFWRNVLFDDTTRKVFAYTHLDVSFVGWANQELLVMGVAIILAISWVFWWQFHERLVGKLEVQLQQEMNKQSVFDIAKRVGEIFDRWQIHSLLIGLAFLPYTVYYIVLSTQYEDVRYYPSAIAIHVIWGLTWYFVSLPAYQALLSWNSLRLNLLHSQNDSIPTDQEFQKYVRSLQPVTHMRVFVVGLATLVTFVLPLLKLVIG
ncbi:MAG: hypothetical protein J0M26_18055 [Planctomycetes bacterium]|nr:hypothetical protein [Planctomycetota bacterium]